MYAYLMGASRLDIALERCHRQTAPDYVEHSPIRYGKLAVFLDYSHALTVDGMSPDERFDSAGLQVECTMNQREIRFLYTCMRGEFPGQTIHCRLAFRSDYDAARLHVKAMDNPRTRHAANAGKIGDVVQDRVDERA